MVIQIATPRFNAGVVVELSLSPAPPAPKLTYVYQPRCFACAFLCADSGGSGWRVQSWRSPTRRDGALAGRPRRSSRRMPPSSAWMMGSWLEATAAIGATVILLQPLSLYNVSQYGRGGGVSEQ